MQYKVKGIHGEHPEVVFRCEACHETLNASLLEAGTDTPCPGCGVVVTVPATRERAEWKRDNAARHREVEERLAAKEASKVKVKQDVAARQLQLQQEAASRQQAVAEVRAGSASDVYGAMQTMGRAIRISSVWVVLGLGLAIATALLDLATLFNLSEWPAGMVLRLVFYAVIGSATLLGFVWVLLVVASVVCETLPVLAKKAQDRE
jgi:hypothetical protein